jgi:hypothetical protein
MERHERIATTRGGLFKPRVIVALMTVPQAMDRQQFVVQSPHKMQVIGRTVSLRNLFRLDEE